MRARTGRVSQEEVEAGNIQDTQTVSVIRMNLHSARERGLTVPQVCRNCLASGIPGAVLGLGSSEIQWMGLLE